MTTFRRILYGAFLSALITALTMALVTYPLLAVDTSGGVGPPTNVGWLGRATKATVLSALLGLLPGAIIGATRAGVIVGALISAVWGFVLGVLTLGPAFNQSGGGLIFVGSAVFLPAAALGAFVGWAVNRERDGAERGGSSL